MCIFDRYEDDELLLDEGCPTLGGSVRYEQRKAALERAKEIHAGMISGQFDRDELVWEFVRKLEELG